MMGPWATHVLAAYGADIIKVEPPDGDIMRKAGPARHADMGPLFLHANGGKRSIVLDLKRHQAREALLRLCATADVFVHNIRPAAISRMALAPADLVAANPRLIYVSLVGYGSGGRYSGHAAYDDLIQGASALASLFERAGAAAPRYCPILLADRVTGISAAHTVLAALLQRTRTGNGQAIEVPMFETIVELVLSDHLGGESFDPPAGPAGYGRLLAPDRRPYRTRDSYIAVLLYNDRHWERFFAAAGEIEHFRMDPHLSNPATRRANYAYAYREVARVIATRTTQEWLDLLEVDDIPAMPLHDIESLIGDPHLRDRGFLQWLDHPSEGRIRTISMPAVWEHLSQGELRPAPRLGEHTIEILREAGLDDAAVNQLIAEGAAVAAQVETVIP
jgi:crotonobetainyl-CoA:carnitine CoA-transferase CaiB-like acyl-CoA transferase